MKNNCLIILLACIWFLAPKDYALAQASTYQLDQQSVINSQVERLKSPEVETRRDAVHQLLVLENAVASRAAAAAALSDKSEIIRATAVKACAILPGDEAAALLIPLLIRDKSEFVRRETAFALGSAHSQAAVPNLIQALQKDKKTSVRAAAAIALGKIGDARSVQSLSQVLLAKLPKKKKTLTENEFVQRSAARALGETRLVTAVPALIAALQNTANAPDVRREAAFALGLIADKAAVPVLTENLQASDYILAETARNALQRIENSAVINLN